MNKFISFVIIFMLLLTMVACNSKAAEPVTTVLEEPVETATEDVTAFTEVTTVPTTEATTEATKTPTEATVVPTQKPTTEPTYKPIEPTVSEPTYGTETEDGLVYLGNYKLTAYCPCTSCCGQWAGQTSTGVTPTAGRTIAVDPSIIPYGSKVVINGHTYIAEDCGGAIKGNRIDVFFNTHGEALQFGVQYADVYIQK